MKIQKITIILILVFVFVVGCGNQELVNNDDKVIVKDNEKVETGDKDVVSKEKELNTVEEIKSKDENNEINVTENFEDRNSSRWFDVASIVSAIKIDQVDNGGQYLSAVSTITDTGIYMIGSGADGSADCASSITCDKAITGPDCVDLGGLVTEGYLGQVPINPSGERKWTASSTGYTIQINKGIISIRSCESEGDEGEIFIVR